MNKKDYELLVDLVDELDLLDEVLQKLTGLGHGEGQFKRIDNIYEVLLHNSIYYKGDDEDVDNNFNKILHDKSKSSSERTELLIL